MAEWLLVLQVIVDKDMGIELPGPLTESAKGLSIDNEFCLQKTDLETGVFLAKYPEPFP